MSRRRAPGEGTIRRRPDGRHEARYVDSNGRRRSVYGRTPTEAAENLRKALRRRDDGDDLGAGRAPTVGQWFTYWLDVVCPRRLKASTLASYRSKVRARIIPALGRHRLDRLTPEHLELFYDGLRAEGLAAATVVQYHRIISRALRVAVQRRKVTRNVTLLLDSPTAGRRPAAIGDTAAAGLVLGALEGRRNAARWLVALALGLRQGEALGLCWGAVDLEAGEVSVAREIIRLPWSHGCAAPDRCGFEWRPMARAAKCPQRKGGGLVLDTPKSRRGARTIALPAPLVEALRRHRQAQREERLAAGSAWQEWPAARSHGGLVFTQPLGRPLDPRRDWGEWKALLEAAGAPDLRVHDARHLAATILLELGVDVRVVSEMLGHSSTYFTQDTYQHVTRRLSRGAADAMGSALWGP